MNIYDLADLSDGEVRALVDRTLSSMPELRRLYDDDFITWLIRRFRLDNFLLLQLARHDDPYAQEFWRQVIDGLNYLDAEGAWSKFHPKLRLPKRFDLESAISELTMAAWMKRRGVEVALEPPTNAGRNADFSAETIPKTWWEIKAIQDLDFLLDEESVARDVQDRLREIDEPYVLTLKESEITLADVPAAVNEIKRQLREHYSRSGAVPATFISNGLVIEASSVTTRSHGYFGVTITGIHSWTDEYADKVAKRIASASKQLPPASAGIVVIDTTMTTWIDHDDIIDACFGVESVLFVSYTMQMVRGRGAFRPGVLTRVSAVVHYSRTTGEEDGIRVIHNPYAAVPLGDAVLAGSDAKQTRRVDRGGGSYALETR